MLAAAKNQLPKHLSRRPDLFEARAWSDLYLAAPQEVKDRARLAVDRIGNAWATSLAAYDVLAFNRAIGVGLGPDPGSVAQEVGALHGFYARQRAARVFVPVHPEAAAALTPRLESSGFRYHNNWVKLYRGTDDVPATLTRFRLVEARGEHGGTLGMLIATCFNFPLGFRGLFSGVVGRLGWRGYLAFDGERPVAAALMFYAGRTAWLGFGCTLPEYRGQGAQQALTARRIEAAREAGCDLIVTETGEETRESPVTSFRNMRRLGFQVGYVRPNYVLVR